MLTRSWIFYGMKNAKPVATTGSVTIAKTVADTPLSPEEHSVYRTAVGKLLWLALIRGDIALCNERVESGCDCPDNAKCCKAQTPAEIPEWYQNVCVENATVVSTVRWQLFSGCECVCGFKTGLDALRQGRAPVAPL